VLKPKEVADMIIRRTHRPSILGLGLAAALALVSNGVLASTPHTGAWHLNDSASAPGVLCRYSSPDNNLSTFRIKPPAVYARDAHPSVLDRQWVGYQAIVRYAADSPGSFVTVGHSTIQKAKASDATAAAFVPIHLANAGPVGGGRYHILLHMIWYKQGSSSAVEGEAWAKVHHYTYFLVSPGSISYCPGGVL
jgi:hypothetical protein